MGKKIPQKIPESIVKLYLKWGQHSLIFTIICLGWLVWRVGTKPSRINYPCAQFAIAQTVVFFSTSTASITVIIRNIIRYIHERQYGKLACIFLFIAVMVCGSIFYKEYEYNQIMIAGSGTIPTPSKTLPSIIKTPDASEFYEAKTYPLLTDQDNAVVSFSYDPSVDYGGDSPYDPADNPAYDFVWDTVARLNLGDQANPLQNLITPGETVLVKPNWLNNNSGVYTRPEVVRPIIDMAIEAGATTIYIGDGGEGVSATNNVINTTGYTDMVDTLSTRNPGIDIELINLNVRDDGWHWIYMSENSSFAGSGITQAELGTGNEGGETLYDDVYYHQTDSQGVNPEGDCLGWYAVNDKILNADVIINVPKMKTHSTMMATLSIKNLVGCTLTLDDQYWKRIAHYHYPIDENYFDNDIFWRAILDVNKIILYADENGDIQATQQRKYLTVIDAIQAKETYNWGSDHNVNTYTILTSVNPVAADAVACRVMRYNNSFIPSIGNAASDTLHPVGTNDPEDIVVVGDGLDSEIDDYFDPYGTWKSDAPTGFKIDDLTPPMINSTGRAGTTVTADITGGLTAYVLYEDSGIEYIIKMNQDGDNYSAIVPVEATECLVIAQDEHFNTEQSEPATIISVTIIDNGATGLSFGNLSHGTDKQPEAASPSVTITVPEESSSVEIYLKGDDFEGTAGTFDVTNAFYNDSDNSDTALSMSTGYSTTAWKTLTPGSTLYIYHWLTIPSMTPAGDYSSTFTYKAKEVSE